MGYSGPLCLDKGVHYRFTWEFTLPELFELMLMSYICKLIYNIVAIAPSSIVVNLLKISEKADVYDSTNFNPFSWEVQQPITNKLTE